MSELVQIQHRTVTSSTDGPHLLITGGVHGDEWEPMVACRQLITEFESRLLRGRVTIAPVVNEAAFRRGWRTADDELDLARVFPGRQTGGITERTALAVTKLIQSADYYIDLHTAGTRLRILPLAGYTLHPNAEVLEAQRKMARAFNLPIVWGTNGRLNGRSLSVARDANIPAIYTELGGGAFCVPEDVRAYVEGCLSVAAGLEMIDREPTQNRIKYVVEDDRDESGHLQVLHPSPVAGFFEPAVELEAVVVKGDLLGSVTDPLGEERADVFFDNDGMVLFLRGCPSVVASDPLAGLLPISGPGTATYKR